MANIKIEKEEYDQYEHIKMKIIELFDEFKVQSGYVMFFGDDGDAGVLEYGDDEDIEKIVEYSYILKANNNLEH